MKVIIVGSKDWSSYNELMRKMTVLIDDWVRTNPEDKVLTVVHTGALGVESMVTEYIGKVEKLFKQKGYAIREKIYNFKGYPGDRPMQDRDTDMFANSGAEKVIVFMNDSCKRSSNYVKLAHGYDIPLEIVKE